MHYKNGREAKNGDLILSLMNPGQPVVGVLFGAKSEAGSDCNGLIAPITPSAQYPQCADLKNCLHIDDIAAATIPDSTVQWNDGVSVRLAAPVDSAPPPTAIGMSEGFPVPPSATLPPGT